MHVIHGQIWMKDHQAKLDYAEECVHFLKDRKSQKLACVTNGTSIG